EVEAAARRARDHDSRGGRVPRRPGCGGAERLPGSHGRTASPGRHLPADEVTLHRGRPPCTHRAAPGSLSIMYILLLSAVAVATASFAQTAVTVPPSAWRAALPARERPLTLPEKVEPGQLHLAVPLDHAGRLEDALPLYHARAEQTQAVADRLRYAGALLRSGRQEDARKVFDALLVERQSGPHGSASSNLLPCASAMIIQGFPDLAVERLRPAYRESPADRRLGLLLARALAATGDRAGARSVLAEIGKGPDTWDGGALVELARSYLLAADPTSARSLLNRDIDESVGHMMRDSVLANLSLLEGDWAGATKLLANGKRKGPPGLDEERVNRTWRNVQRELRSMQLRLGLGLWREGKPATPRGARPRRGKKRGGNSPAAGP